MAMMGRELNSCSEPGRYDVFLSYDSGTRLGFAGHLYSALEQSEVNVFNDDEELRSEKISPTVLKAICNSSIAVVVLSETYASSRRCLNVVANIMECRSSKGLIVVPVFYGVDPSDVSRQSGTYGEAFAHHKEKCPPIDVEMWRGALRAAAILNGLKSKDRSDNQLVKEIVSVVLSKLEVPPFLDPANSVERYDVFLCFRGIDTRRGFTGHLYSALVQSEVNVFKDDENLPIGEEIGPEIRVAIQNSRIAIVVLSENFASSKWCLNDVAMIMDCRKSKGTIVIPVFYGVDPSDVRHQTGRYGEAFARHEQFYESHSVESWRIALEEAALMEGFALKDGPEGLLIQEIVRWVLSKQEHLLDDTAFHVPANLVGMNSHLKAVYKLLDKDKDNVRMVALCGMGGIGKTTIAKTIFKQIGQDFRNKGLSPKVREICQNSPRGLLKVQKKLLSQMGIEEKIWDDDDGSEKIKQRCRSIKTLLLIDDIDKREQLEKLAGACDWFAPGSKIIITTRRKDLLNDRGEILLYEVPLLEDHDAYLLFQSTLFQQKGKVDEYEDLIPVLLKYTQGLPLAIIVVAAKLRWQEESKWPSTLEVLKRNPDADIMEVLELSYDDLNKFERDTLLDIACFHKGQPLNYVRNILDCCGLQPDSVLGVLLSRYLISLKYDKVDMHDMIQEMGREIVQRDFPKDPGKHSRLWSEDSILEVITEETGKKKIEGIKLEFVSPKDVHFSANALAQMRRLRVFIAHNARPSENSINFPEKLKWLEWPDYPFPSLPLHKHDNGELAGLYLSKSGIRLSDNDLKTFSSLRYINFSKCTSLRKIPDVSSLSHLESLDAEECKELAEVHQSLGSLEKLVHLNFLNCSKLRTFPITLNSKVLQDLLLKGCSKLSKFPEILVKMEKLKELALDETAIDELPSSIGNLTGLEKFYLENCRKFKTLPSSIYRLRRLQRVSFADCSVLGQFPEYGDGSSSSSEKVESLKDRDESSGPLPALIYLDLQRCGLQEIDFLKDLNCKATLENLDLSESKLRTVPKCIEEFIALQKLNLENCKQLQDIQGLPPKINYLVAKGCESLEWHVPLSGMLKSQWEESPLLRQIDFSGCSKLTQDLSTSANFFSMEDLLVKSQIKILYPGSEIPKWFDHLRAEGSLNFSLDTKLYRNIAGLVFCVVIGSEGRKIATLSCEIQVYNNNQTTYHTADNFHSLEMDHMWLVYVPCTMMWGWETRIPKRCSELKVIFKLSRGIVKRCGVHPLLKADGSRKRPKLLDAGTVPPDMRRGKESSIF